ncbi:MAG: hypothetical protein ACON42_07350 [Flavobacteriaceae bacterium]
MRPNLHTKLPFLFSVLLTVYCSSDPVEVQETKLQTLQNAIDLGVNAQGDLVYLKQNRYTVSVIKNGQTLVTHRNNRPNCVDITPDGKVLTNASGYNSYQGKYPYTTIDISAGGSEVYCLAANTKNTRLYRWVNDRWTMSVDGVESSRLTVDTRGRPWLIFNSEIRLYTPQGTYSSIAKPETASRWEQFLDIGTAGEEVYITLEHAKTHKRSLYKLNSLKQTWEKQAGAARRIDGSADGTLWTN